MTLTNPREALADKSDFIGYLVGLAALANLVRGLAADGAERQAGPTGDCDDFVYVLLGLVSTGTAIERMSNSASALTNPGATPSIASSTTRLLR